MTENAKFPSKLKMLFRPYRYKVSRGGRGCVHGDTLLETPCGPIPIKDFNGGHIYVVGPNGVDTAAAQRPIKYHKEMLYKVTTEDGSSVMCTAKHKFLTPDGWAELSSLSCGCLLLRPLESSASPQEKHYVSCRLEFHEDVSRCFRIVLGWLYCCLEGLSRYDELPPRQLNTYSDVLPLLIERLQHNCHVSMSEDGQESVCTNAHQHILRLPSSLRALFDVVARNYREMESYTGEKSFELLSVFSLLREIFREKKDPVLLILKLSEQLQALYSSQCSDKTHQIVFDMLSLSVGDSSFSASFCKSLKLNNITTASPIRSIEKCKEQVFYDIFIPFYNNYIANGMIHHNSSKSWSFARALLILGAQRKIRILCAREVQLSIKQSVHKLLKDQIELLELTSYYEVLEAEIRGRNGTEIAFTGLSTLTVDTIKSFEGYDICWVEEGQAISKRSWDILIPTIRKNDSEIWITYNPDLETDETHQRFTINPPDNCVNVEMNWRDNPWFNDVLEQERLHCKETSPDDYDNIWEGQCRSAIDGAIYFKQIQEAENQGRICNVPYDPLLKVHIIVDLGFNDAMSIGMIQKQASEVRVIDYIEENQKTLADYSTLLNERKYNWGKVYLPFSDGFSKGVKTGKGSDEILRALGWDVVDKIEIANKAVEEGIRQTRLLFSQMYFDKNKCSGLIEALRRYRRHINRATSAPGSPVHDDFSHGADMLRYVSINIDHMTNETDVEHDFNNIGLMNPGGINHTPGVAWMGN